MPISHPLSEGGFGREGDTLEWNVCANTGQSEWRGGRGAVRGAWCVCTSRSPSHTVRLTLPGQVMGICGAPGT